jgi:site-specific DNA-adenine methylase
MPPHKRYIESHLGGGAVMRNKSPAQEQLGIDIDPSVIAMWMQLENMNCNVVNGDAVKILEEIVIDKNTLIYADPPYYPETRRRKKVYKFDYTDDDHMKLIECLIKKQCMVIISGYFSHLYASEFKNWNIYKFQNKTHIGIVDEYVWFNFDKPNILHDIRFLGENFREREIIKRRSDRLKSRLSRLSAVEQSAILEWLNKEINARIS